MLTSRLVYRPVLLVLLLTAVAARAVPALGQTTGDPRSARPNTWTARSSTGLTLAGTWTATPDPATGAVRGTWTLLDASGRTAARGSWAAAKSETGWSGGWRAAVTGRGGEYSGTWTARVDLKPGDPFSALFEKSLEGAVSGNWRAAGRSGTWSIQAFK